MLETYLASQVILLSVVAKFSDRDNVVSWLYRRFKKVRGAHIISETTYAIIILSEIVIFISLLLAGPKSGIFTTVVLLTILILSALYKLTFNKSEKCPCFGILTTNGLDGTHIILVTSILVTAIYTLSNVLQTNIHNAVLIAMIDMVGATIFIITSQAQKLSWTGSKIKVRPTLKNSYEILNIKHPCAIIFLSANCPTCKLFIKMINEFSDSYAKYYNLYLIIHDLKIEENLKFGSATIVHDKKSILSNEFSVKNVPTLVFSWDAKRITKYEGLDSSILALTRAIHVKNYRSQTGNYSILRTED